MASFGVTTPMVSTVLSVFMAGLALGSWGGGRLAARLAAPAPALRGYAAAELLIGAGGLLVPAALTVGRRLLSVDVVGAAWDSSSYYVASAAWIALVLLPPSTCMGATFPLAMAAIRSSGTPGSERSFSLLYLGNVLGATLGTLLSAFVLIELLGFGGTLLVAAGLNAAIAVIGLALAVRARDRRVAAPPRPAAAPASARGVVLGALFLTGLVSMAMEVVWTRHFAPHLGTFVYAFAGILAVYLAATYLGSALYRRWAGALPGAGRGMAWPWIAAGLLGLAPLVAADARLPLPAVVRLVVGIAPFCAVVGLLTPMLVDRWSEGRPDRAGVAYGANVVGSIAGPLVAGFALLPWVGERSAIVVLAAPLFAAAALALLGPAAGGRRERRSPLAALAGALVLALMMVTSTQGYETRFADSEIRRDHTATVIAVGSGWQKRLVVNGEVTTVLTPITKMMAHLPLVFRERPARNALVICFGMGTTYRSLLSWGIDVTAVELVPSVPTLFAFYHADAPALLRLPRGRIVIDDGRRFLEREAGRFDVITIDPPHPVEAAGSSLLYSREFYAAVRRRLADDGIVQQWLPGDDGVIIAAAARALVDSFPHVRVFPRLMGQESLAGIFFVASNHPLPRLTPGDLAARMPPAAVGDLVEWQPGSYPVDHFGIILSSEAPIAAMLGLAPSAPTLVDDRPVNEYFFVRRWLGIGG
jgi:spermidine synthase